MKFIIKRFFSGFCTFEIEAENEDIAYEMCLDLPIDEDGILSTLEDWKEADTIEMKEDD